MGEQRKKSHLTPNPTLSCLFPKDKTSWAVIPPSDEPGQGLPATRRVQRSAPSAGRAHRNDATSPQLSSTSCQSKRLPRPNPAPRRPVQAYRCIFAARLNTDANIWLLGRTLPQSPRNSCGVSRPPPVSGCFAASLSPAASPELTHLAGLHLVQKLPKCLRGWCGREDPAQPGTGLC